MPAAGRLLNQRAGSESGEHSNAIRRAASPSRLRCPSCRDAAERLVGADGADAGRGDQWVDTLTSGLTDCPGVYRGCTAGVPGTSDASTGESARASSSRTIYSKPGYCLTNVVGTSNDIVEEMQVDIMFILHSLHKYRFLMHDLHLINEVVNRRRHRESQGGMWKDK